MRPAAVALLASVLAVAAFLAGAWLRDAGSPAVPAAGVGSAPAPAPRSFAFVDQDGRSRRLADWRGRIVVVNFWATWCAPCREEIPALVDLQRDLGPRGVQVVGIALDDMENVEPFAASLGVNYPTAAGGETALDLMRAYGNTAGALPYTVVLGRDGAILDRHLGIIVPAELRARLESLLASPGTP